MILGIKYFAKNLHIFVIFLILSVFGCAGSVQKETLDEYYHFESGMKNMNKKNYLNAIQDFETVVDTFPGSEIVDHAQFMLGEANYKNEDYITAAYEYERVYMDFPSSKYAADAWYKKAMCWFMESPKANLDQENTYLAIDEFKRFIDNFPRNSLAEDARKKVVELGEKLALKDYKNGEQYRKMKAYDAALLYYRFVIKEFPRSVWVNYCRYGMGLVHIKLMKQELETLKKLQKANNTDQKKFNDAKEKALQENEQAKNMFTLVINSDVDSDIRKKASKKLSELEKLKDIK